MEEKNKSPYTVKTLENGMRMVHQRSNGLVAYTGVLVNAGTRDEDPDKEGLAHFVEHTLFKGTQKRSSLQVSRHLEDVGGELNAYTTKEETMIYTNVPAEYSDRAYDLLGDIICHSCFPEKEVEREKFVVMEEIKSYLDNPAETAFDDFDNHIYKGSQLGHPILGTTESVEHLTAQDCRDFVERHYTPGEMVLFSYDPSPAEKVFEKFQRHFGGLARKDEARCRRTPEMLPQFRITNPRDSHQAHTIIGARTISRTDPRRFPLYLLNNHLGGPNMTSVFNQLLREKKGYVYTVDSYLGLLSDCGTMQIYFGADQEYVKPCTKIIYDTLQKMADHLIGPKVFERIKRQYIGQMLVGSDNAESKAFAMAKSMMHLGRPVDPSETAEAIKRVTAEEVKEVAQMLTPDHCSSYCIL